MIRILDLTKKEVVEFLALARKMNKQDVVEEYNFLSIRGYSLGFILMVIFGG